MLLTGQSQQCGGPWRGWWTPNERLGSSLRPSVHRVEPDMEAALRPRTRFEALKLVLECTEYRPPATRQSRPLELSRRFTYAQAMVEAHHYVPILLTRRGERRALAAVDDTVRTVLSPLMVVPPIPWDYDSEQPAKTLEQYLAPLPQELAHCIGPIGASIDLVFLDDDQRVADGRHPLAWVVEEARSLGSPLVPVCSIARSADYLDAVSRLVAQDDLGVCIRLEIGEWPSDRPGEFDGLLQQLSVAPPDVDLILDVGSETGPLAGTALRSEIEALPSLLEWRSVVIAGAGMPKEMPSGQGLHVLPRSEWIVYEGLFNVNPEIGRVPSFGDYGIAHPDPVVDVDPKVMNISGTFRYTTGENWLFARGPLFKGRGGSGIGGAALTEAASRLTAHPDYQADHCSVEEWLESVADGSASGGNPEAWRREATLHHLRVVAEQLSNLHAS